jgi:fluoroquinolone resistance protein
VVFKDCKLMGLRFDEIDEFLFQVSFTGCNLQLSSFYQKNLSHTKFAHCNLEGVDFTGITLLEATFEQCNLRNALFDRANLEKSNFSTSYHIQIDLDRNKLKNAKFSIEGALGLLVKYKIKIE